MGGKPGQGLTPMDIVRFTSAFGSWVLSRHPGVRCKVVIGRDARISGPMVSGIVVSTLNGLGIDVVDTGLSTTPTVEVAVVHHKAQGGIILTASHNPKQWNALKLLNEHGEFISGSDGEEVLRLASIDDYSYADVNSLGSSNADPDAIQRHIAAIMHLPLVDKSAIAAAGFSVVVDAVNSSGGIAVPLLLRELGVKEVHELHCTPDGHFPHNPEPLPEHLGDLSREVQKKHAHLGFVVDPDVDRLAIVCEDGEMFGEEYTLVAVADYVLQNTKGNTVSNLSSTRALRDVTEKHGCSYSASAVGEVNVVETMKATGAVIGGEGNGGIIYPELHFGRDALVGIALFLSHLARFGKSCSMLRSTYPDYHISKNKIELTPEVDVDHLLAEVVKKYSRQPMNLVDGVKIEFDKEWVHLRRSNTEPIIRIYSESTTLTTAEALASKLISDIKDMLSSMLTKS